MPEPPATSKKNTVVGHEGVDDQYNDLESQPIAVGMEMLASPQDSQGLAFGHGIILLRRTELSASLLPWTFRCSQLRSIGRVSHCRSLYLLSLKPQNLLQ